MSDVTCSIDGCERASERRGWCSAHYQRWRKHGDPTIDKRSTGRTPCTIEGCDAPVFALGYCSLHRGRFLRHGDPLAIVRVAGETSRRFWIHADTNGPLSELRPDLGRCWLWRSMLTEQRYALISDGGRKRSAHRYAYELLVGPIPDGLELDHLCMVRHCVNPGHLDPVTKAENLRRRDLAQAAASSP